MNSIGTAHVPEDLLESLRPHFDEREISELSFTAAMINAWNMLNVGLSKPLPDA